MRREQRPVYVYSQVPPPFHGSAMMTLNLIQALRDESLEVVLLDRRFSRSSDAVGKPSLSKILRVPSLVGRALRVPRGGVCVFFITNRLGSFLVDVMVLAVLRARRVKVVHYVHTFGYHQLSQQNRLLGALVRWCFGNANPVVVLSRGHAEDLVGGGVQATPRLISNACKPVVSEVYASTLPKVVYFATVSTAKGAEVFLEVAARTSQLRPDLKFEMYGAVAEDRMTSLIANASQTIANFSYCGEIRDDETKRAVLGSASILLYPSTYKYEAQPLAIIEAMSAGVYTIAYPAGSIMEMLDPSCGQTVHSVEEMVSALLQSVDRASSLATRQDVRRKFDEDHSLEAFSRRWMRVLNEAD